MNTARTALVVEDNPADARLVREHLHESAPYLQCVHVERLSDALGCLTDKTFDIILLDAQLPDSRGVHTVARIRSAALTTPIVVLTGNPDEEFGAACLESGAQDFIVKQHATPALLALAVRNAEARKRVELALQESEANYRGLFENSCVPIAQIQTDGTIIRINHDFVELFGHAEGDTGPDNIVGYFVDPDVFHALMEFRQSSFHEVETLWRKHDGTTATVSLSGRHVTSSIPVGGWIELIAQDVGERRALEDQLRQAQKLEAVAQLAGGVAHDLNNVLAIILAEVESASVAKRAAPNANIDAELKAIRDTTRRGARLVKHLLGYSRQQRLTLDTLEINNVVAEVVGMVRRIVPKSIHVALSANEGKHWVRADATAVEQMMLNLITNARDAIGTQGTITVGTARVDVTRADIPRDSQAVPGQFIRVRVSDDGAGMSPEVQTRVFEPFYSTKPKGVGTGLGLSSVHGLAAQHAGFVAIRSQLRAGTAVDVYIPCVPEPESGAGETKGELATDRLGGTETILLVDDETGLRKVGRRLLERYGYRVHTAASGVEALQLYQNGADAIDLVITDVIMPGMTGFELRRAIGALDASVPFLFMSGYNEEQLPQIVESGAPVSVIEKPWEVAHMLSAVRRALERDPEFVRLLRDSKNTDGAPKPRSLAHVRSAPTLMAELKDAVRHSRFEIHFQPEYDLEVGGVAAAEALLRWRRENGIVVPPSEFIPMLEDAGLMTAVGAWVISRACKSLKRFRRNGFRGLRVAVNVGQDQLSDERFMAEVQASLKLASLEPGALEVEIDEGTLVRNALGLKNVVDQLRGLGVRVAIDNFGRGQSSLAHLSSFDVDTVKVDRSFIAKMTGNTRQATVINGFVDIAHRLGLNVVAGGVETRHQVDELRRCRCELMQGFFFGKPNADLTIAC